MFPNPRYASKEGLLAYGGDLSPERLLEAYSSGIFPWFGENDPILWWSPDPRAILYPKEFQISTSLKKKIRSNLYEYKIDANFASVISHCASVKRLGQNGTWIVPQIIEAYTNLHKLGFAHSFEVYFGQRLVGGLYGIRLGNLFFGESMFHLMRDCSKLAMYSLCEYAKKESFDFIDCQMPTPHLLSLGAKTVSRDDYLDMLYTALNKG